MRTPKSIIKKAKDYFAQGQVVIEKVDKRAYLSALKLADHIVVTCDSTSMISESAMTGKPIYVAQMPTNKSNKRFENFFRLFESLKIIKNLDTVIDSWNYKRLDEANKISAYLKNKMNEYDFS